MFNFDNNNITNFIIVFLSAILGYIVQKISSKNSCKSDVINKQFYSVYLPLYIKLKDDFYQEISFSKAKEYINFFNNIKAKSYELIDVKLIDLFKDYEVGILKGYPSFSTYENICYRIDNLFEQYRKKLKLPTKSLFYKFKNKQLPNGKLYSILSVVWFLKYYSIFITVSLIVGGLLLIINHAFFQ